jgi:ribosomal protein S10
LSRIFKLQDWDPELIEGLRDIGAQAGIQVQIVKEELK